MSVIQFHSVVEKFVPGPGLLGCAANITARSALGNIRPKALLSSVGFRKRMTSRSPRSS